MVTLLVGDAVAQMATLPKESVQCVVTSPPYWGLRDYGTPEQVWGGDLHTHQWGDQEPHGRRGKRGVSGTGGNLHPTLDATGQGAGSGGGGAWCQSCEAWRGSLGAEPTPDLFVEHLVGIFREVKRVLRKDGTLWLNLGDCYASAWPCQRRNEVGSGSLPDGKRAARPPRLAGGLKEKDLVGIPWMVAFALRADGWYLRSDIIWSKNNPMPSSVTDRPSTSHEYLFLLTKSPRYYYDATAIREKATMKPQRRLTQRHSDRDAAMAAHKKYEYQLRTEPAVEGGGTRNKRSVWHINTAGSGIPHYATFPPALVRPCVLAGTSEKGCCSTCGAPWERVTEKHRTGDRPGRVQGRNGDHLTESHGHDGRSGNRCTLLTTTTGWQPTCCCEAGEPVPCQVLDPFGGVGTTASVAHLLGRDAISIDLDPASVDHFPVRLAGIAKQKPRRPKAPAQRLLPMEDE